MMVIRRQIIARAIVMAALSTSVQMPANGIGLVDEFTISLEEQVSNGVPGPGAGNLEAAGALDRYFITIDPNTLVYFDEVAGGCGIVWRCIAPDASQLFNNNAICVGDPGSMLLTQGGTYTIEVYSNNNSTGTYSFVLWEVNAPELFAIDLKQPVSNGVPGPGAGNIEEPGAIDQYTLSVAPPIAVYFDELNASSCALNWRCQAPDGTMLFDDNALCVGDPGVFVLDQSGAYTITAYSPSGPTGTYSFTLWALNEPQTFAIDLKQIVSNGVPEPGAGNIEEPGAIDHYTFSAELGTLVYFDELSASTCGLNWRCEAPDGEVLFNDNALCVGDPGAFLIEQEGQYTISAYGIGSNIGTYSFVLQAVNPVESFTIQLEQTVSNGVPARGAGNLEEPGAIDEYTLTVGANTLVFFDELAGPCDISWQCLAPDQTVIFASDPICAADPGTVLLTEGGDYTLRVFSPWGAAGTYSFIVWEVDPPQAFEIDLDEVVSPGVPGAGAGEIEEPGAIDEYSLTVSAGAIVCFEELSGPCELGWSCEDANGVVIFDDLVMCAVSPGKHTLALGGTYTIRVEGVGDGAGEYSFIVHSGNAADINGDCHVNVSDLLMVIAAWGPCPIPDDCPADIDGNGSVDVSDLLAVIANWG